MAERRMFAKTIIDSDAFLDMPLSTQALYFHLSMRADDDGFINNPKKVQRSIGCSADDLKVLIAKNFIIPFESGVVVIKHWKIHNYIRNDRYKETVYQEEKALLEEKDNKAYTLGIPNGYQVETQVRLGKDSLGKDSLGKSKGSKPETVYYPMDEKLNKAFADYVEMRKQIKKPMTERAIELSRKKLEELSDNDNDLSILILEQSVMNCWQGLFPLKEEKQQPKKTDDFMEMWRNA
jgi:hypothetical protein